MSMVITPEHREKMVAGLKVSWERRRAERPLDVRFWEKVSVGTDCWLWTAATDKDGYGTIWVSPDRVKERAHRIAWELTYGPIPEGKMVCHHCDARRCVRLSHLYLGDQESNMHDMAVRLRNGKRRLELEEAVLILSSQLPTAVLARQLSVHPCTVRDVRKRRTWRHVEVLS